MPDTIKSIIDLFGILPHLQQWCAGAIPWFRGQSQQGWSLLPKAFRNGEEAGCSWEVAHKYEVNRTTQFLLDAKVRHATCPANDDKAGWLSLMQHYELATRLLDWSQSVLVGAFFAVREKEYDNYDGAIWALNPAALNERHGKGKCALPLDDKEVFPHVRCAFSLEAPSPEEILAVCGQQVDLRMLVQQSAFTVHGVLRPLETMIKDAVRKFCVPAASKQQIRSELACLGITASSLFPDLIHLASDINQRSYVGIQGTETPGCTGTIIA